MFNFLFIFTRVISKYFKHLFSGKSEIERAVIEGDLALLGMYLMNYISYFKRNLF